MSRACSRSFWALARAAIFSRRSRPIFASRSLRSAAFFARASSRSLSACSFSRARCCSGVSSSAGSSARERAVLSATEAGSDAADADSASTEAVCAEAFSRAGRASESAPRADNSSWPSESAPAEGRAPGVRDGDRRPAESACVGSESERSVSASAKGKTVSTQIVSARMKSESPCCGS